MRHLRDELLIDFRRGEMAVCLKVAVLLAAGKTKTEIAAQLAVAPADVRAAAARLERIAPSAADHGLDIPDPWGP